MRDKEQQVRDWRIIVGHMRAVDVSSWSGWLAMKPSKIGRAIGATIQKIDRPLFEPRSITDGMLCSIYMLINEEAMYCRLCLQTYVCFSVKAIPQASSLVGGTLFGNCVAKTIVGQSKSAQYFYFVEACSSHHIICRIQTRSCTSFEMSHNGPDTMPPRSFRVHGCAIVHGEM